MLAIRSHFHCSVVLFSLPVFPTDLLLFSMVRWPMSIARGIWWHLRWFIKFTLLRQEYGPEEQDYATAKVLNCDYDK